MIRIVVQSTQTKFQDLLLSGMLIYSTISQSQSEQSLKHAAANELLFLSLIT